MKISKNRWNSHVREFSSLSESKIRFPIPIAVLKLLTIFYTLPPKVDFSIFDIFNVNLCKNQIFPKHAVFGKSWKIIRFSIICLFRAFSWLNFLKNAKNLQKRLFFTHYPELPQNGIFFGKSENVIFLTFRLCIFMPNIRTNPWLEILKFW